MSVPGSNLLNMALRLIAPQPFDYYAFVTRTQNAVYQDIATYDAPVTFLGSVQPVPRSLYEQNGLDLQKSYMMFYVSLDVLDVTRDVSGDMMNFGGSMYQCLSDNDWFPMDGWMCVLAVQVQNVPLVELFTPPEDGNYITAEQLNFSVNYNYRVNVVGVPSLVLAALESGVIGGDAVYQSGSGTQQLIFSYTVQDTDSAPSGISVVSLISVSSSATISNASGNIPANISFIAPDLSGVTLNA